LTSEGFYFIPESFRNFEVGASLPIKVILTFFFPEVLSKVDGTNLNLIDLVRVEPLNALSFFPESRFF
jgi:hypothetical protein